MSNYYNTNIVFRCPVTLKQKMKSIAESRDEHLSSFIRSACVEVVRRENSSVFAKPDSVSEFPLSKCEAAE